MDNEQRGKFKWQMLELPDGITTSNGNWYHITRSGIENYIPGLLKKYELEEIIRYTDAWLKSPGIFSLLLYFILALIGVDPFISAFTSLIYYTIWFFNLSTFVFPAINPVIKLIQTDGFIYITAAAILIYLSYQNFEAMWVGLGLFFLFKVGLLRLALNWYLNKKESKNTSKADRVLNMMLIRLGMKEGILTKNIQQMEQEFLRVVNYHKERNNK